MKQWGGEDDGRASNQLPMEEVDSPDPSPSRRQRQPPSGNASLGGGGGEGDGKGVMEAEPRREVANGGAADSAGGAQRCAQQRG